MKKLFLILLFFLIPACAHATGPCAGPVSHCVVINWTPPTLDVSGNPITGLLTYDVYRSTTPGNGYVKITISTVSATSFEDDSIVNGTTYYYVVVAYQGASTASANSGEAVGVIRTPGGISIVF